MNQNGISSEDFRIDISNYVNKKYTNSDRILDVGAGAGLYVDMLGKKYVIDAVEAYVPNVTENHLKERYDFVFECDVMSLSQSDFMKYRLVILGDMLEHLSTANAHVLIKTIEDSGCDVIVKVPWNYSQDAMYGNDYEIHKQPDLTAEIMKARYPSLDPFFVNNRCGVYINSSNNRTVCAELSTRGRYWTTLPMSLMSIAMQTRTPDKLILYDDNPDPTDLRKNFMYSHIFGLLQEKRISWSVLFTKGRGQVHNHQEALTNACTKYVWRLDDDVVAEPDVLETLLSKFDDTIGAVSCMIHHPSTPILDAPEYALSLLHFKEPEWTSREWFRFDGDYDGAEHLYSTFLYDREAGTDAGGYMTSLSRVGHCEETIFSNRIKRSGKKLVITGDCRLYHLRNPEGGIRDSSTIEMFQSDEKKFLQYMNFDGSSSKIFYLNNGIGDHYAFRMALPIILAATNTKNVTIAACYPDVFHGMDVKIISLDAANAIMSPEEIERCNVYAFIAKTGWKSSIVDAFVKIYTSE